MAGKKSVYEIITERVIERIQQSIQDETGIAPWKKPWSSNGGVPRNYITNRPYRGLNAWFLEPGTYCTWNQFCDLQKKFPDISIRKGCHKQIVVYFNILEKETETDDGDKEKVKIPLLKYYQVFSTRDILGLPEPEKQFTHDPIVRAEEIIQDYVSRVGLNYQVCKSDRAYFRPSEFKVVIPELSQYSNSRVTEYYSTIFHELGHSTSIPLKRCKEGENYQEQYSREELTAELCSQMCLSQIGLDGDIETTENSISYLKSWLQVLKNDCTFIVKASSQAQKAADLILNINYSAKEEEEVA